MKEELQLIHDRFGAYNAERLNKKEGQELREYLSMGEAVFMNPTFKEVVEDLNVYSITSVLDALKDDQIDRATFLLAYKTAMDDLVTAFKNMHNQLASERQRLGDSKSSSPESGQDPYQVL